MKESLSEILYSKEFSSPEKVCAILAISRSQICRILERAGFMGRIPSFFVREIVDEIIWQIHERTGVMDNLENKDFMEDLEEFKSQYEIDQNASVVYIGSNNDTSVRRVFPQTLHIDRYRPKRSPKGFNFIQTDARNLPNDDLSVDVAIIKCANNILLIPEAIKELQRVLKLNGKILVLPLIDDKRCTEPETIADFEFQADNLNILQNLHQYEFKKTKHLSNGTAMVERGQVSDDEKKHLENIYQRNKPILYKLIISEQHEIGMGQLYSIFDLPFPHFSYEEYKKRLEEIRKEVPPEVFRIIEDIAKEFLRRVKQRNS